MTRSVTEPADLARLRTEPTVSFRRGGLDFLLPRVETIRIQGLSDFSLTLLADDLPLLKCLFKFPVPPFEFAQLDLAEVQSEFFGSPSDSLTTSRRWDLLEKGNTALHCLDLLGFLPTLRASRPGKTRFVFGPEYPAVADLSESLQYIGFGPLNASHKSANLTESQFFCPDLDLAASSAKIKPGPPKSGHEYVGHVTLIR
jgi:hypothetical protein